MLVAGCSMLVEDPVFSGDKDFPIYSDWKYYQFVVRSFSKDKKVIKFLISSSIQKPVPLQRDIFTLFAPQYIEIRLKIHDFGLYRRLVVKIS